jgi:hypothetical protein
LLVDHFSLRCDPYLHGLDSRRWSIRFYFGPRGHRAFGQRRRNALMCVRDAFVRRSDDALPSSPWSLIGLLISRAQDRQLNGQVWARPPKWGPLSGPKSPKLPESDFKTSGALPPDDDRLNAAVSHAP